MYDEQSTHTSSKTSMLAGVGAVGGLLSGFAALVAILREPTGQVERVQVELKHPEVPMAVREPKIPPEAQPKVVDEPEADVERADNKPTRSTYRQKSKGSVGGQKVDVNNAKEAKQKTEEAKQKAEADALAAPYGGGGYGVGGLGLVTDGSKPQPGTIGLGNTGLIQYGGGGAGFAEGKVIPKVRQSKAKIEGALDHDIVKRIVRAHINEVRYCYKLGLEKHPNLKGRIVVNYTIASDGTVKSAKLASSTLTESETPACIVKAMKRWKYPKPRGGGEVTVGYPFVLAPG